MSRYNDLDYDLSKLHSKLKSVYGKKIAKIMMRDHGVALYMQDGTLVDLADSGQCCEVRYATTDDREEDYSGAELLGVELADGGSDHGSDRGGYGHSDCHEIQFLRIHTSKGDFVVANHNEHNGYYSGFDIGVTLTIPGEEIAQEPP